MTKPTNVVVAYDFSTHASAVLERAISLVARAPFHVLHFITVLDPRRGIELLPPDGPVDFAYTERVRELITARIAEAFQAARLDADVQFFIHARIGSPADEILELAGEVGADLIFIGTHGHTGLRHLLLGSVAERVVREAGCPVMVVRAKAYPDVTLAKMVEVPDHKRPTSRRYLLSYQNNTVIVRPPDWPSY